MDERSEDLVRVEHPVATIPIRPITPRWEVVVDRDLPLRGECRLDEQKIVLRTFDEEVLLHEVLHALLHAGGMTKVPGYGDDRRSLVYGIEEDVVSHLSHGLFQAGWRWVEMEQSGEADNG